jgi:hypothetical protein
MEICAYILCFCEDIIYELSDCLTFARNIIVVWQFMIAGCYQPRVIQL